MSFGDEIEQDGGEGGIGTATARGREWPSVRQFNVFVENRIGGLMSIVRRFELVDVRILSLMVVDSIDVAVIRMVFDDPERAVEILKMAKLPFTESDLLVVKMPEVNQPLLAITKSLLQGEININYVYPMLIQIGPDHCSALALHVEDLENANLTLQRNGFTIVTDNDLKDCE